MTAAPRVWVLLGKGKGGNDQMVALAEALGWPYETRQIVYNRCNRLPNLVLGASRLSVDKSCSAALAPPWPDLVIGASRRSAPLARWIKKRSGDRALLVHLFHAQAPLHHFDLIITLPQYRLPARDNVLQLSGALNRIAPEVLERAAAAWAHELSDLPRPFIALIVGGNSSSYELDVETARRLGRAASAAARARSGSLLISSTPRTPAAAADAVFASVDVPAYRYRWRRDDPHNPYYAFLALADRFIVTVDSASLPMEACATGKPVSVFEWPRRPAANPWLKGLMGSEALSGLHQWLVYWGLIKPTRDFDAYHRALRERGVVQPLGEDDSAVSVGSADELQQAAGRIRELMNTELRLPRCDGACQERSG